MAERTTNRESAAAAEGYSMLARGDFRPPWHHFAAGVLRWSGALRAGQALARMRGGAEPRILILCYHRVGTGGIPFYSELPKHLFESQMRFLRRHYRILSLSEACRELASRTSNKPAVVVTFDDGYGDLFPNALPVLQRYEIPATVYLTVGAIEAGAVAWYDRIFLALKCAPGTVLECDLGETQTRRFLLSDAAARFAAAVEIITFLRTLPDARRRELCAELDKRVQLPPAELANRMLTWEQIRVMQEAGISFGCHTMTHPAVSRLMPSEMETELVQCKGLMEKRLGAPVVDFAYPFGKPADCGTGAQALLQRAGYRSAVTTRGGVNVSGVNPYELLRVNPGDERSLAMFAVQINGYFLRAEARTTGVGHSEASPAEADKTRRPREVAR